MPDRSREAVAPLYLFLCLLLGGSAQGIWANMLLQLLGLGLIAWAAIAPGEPLARPARQLLLIALLGVGIIALQLIALPPDVWRQLPGRESLWADYSVLGIPAPALPVSLTPHESLDSLLALIPPLAVFCAMVRLRAYRPSWMAVALLAGMTLGVLLSALQVGSGAGGSRWYLYPATNFGTGVGFFANTNQMGNLLVISLPFLAALAAAGRRANIQGYSALLAWLSGTALVVMVGIALNGSLAAAGLAIPVLLASALILIPKRTGLQRAAIAGAALMLVGAAALLATSPVGSNWLQRQQGGSSVQTRQEMIETSSRAIADFMPFGSGLGSFRDVYHLYEQPSEVTRTYVVHAHNDYVELALETGVPGVFVILLFLAWWAAAAWRAWRSAEAGPFARAASIASAAILVHSLVDFPLRTAAISAAMAMFVAMLADRRAAPARRDAGDLRPTRHFVLR